MRPASSLRIMFTVWVVLIIAVSIGFFAGVELVLARFGLLGELDTIGKALPVVLSSLLMLPFGIAVAAFAMRYPMRPVKKLLQSMKRLSEGHFEERVYLGRFGAMKEMADTFNSLANELQNTEMLRSDFVNDFSHEFKTPIVSISGFAKLLQRGGLTPQQHREYVDVIVEESTRLANMATNVLNLTRIEKQTILASITEYNLSEQLRKCILLLEKKWTEKQLEVVAGFGEQMVAGDQELLQQVWLNLLDNAIKFSPVGGELSVKIGRQKERMLVSVVNHGPMLTEEEQKRMFDKFWQGDPSRAGKGNGIGLSVVKKIIELHKGDVHVESSPEETVFCVSLPCVPPDVKKK